MKYDCLKYNTSALFAAVCDDLGECFAGSGFRYAKSTHKLWKKFKDFKLHIEFRSSHYNRANDWCCMEIGACISVTNKDYFLDDGRGRDLIVYDFKEKSEEAESKNCRILRKIFGEEDITPIEKMPGWEPCIFHSTVENLCLINEENFQLLRDFIQNHIVTPAEILAQETLLKSRAKRWACGEEHIVETDAANTIALVTEKHDYWGIHNEFKVFWNEK